MMGWVGDRYREGVLAFLLLTRLPMPAIAIVPDDKIGGRVWAFPLVGAAIGAVGAAAYITLHLAGVPVPLCALAAVLATVIATGAFHEDGFADFFDGVGGGQSLERKLEIMRDSRIGTYGAVALLASIAARVMALAALAEPVTVALALITTHAAARGLIGLIFLTLSPARKEGLAASGDRPKPVFAITALGLGLASLWIWPWPVAIIAGLAGGFAVSLIGLIGWRYLGGYTGDMLGASEQAAEIAMLTALSAMMAQ